MTDATVSPVIVGRDWELAHLRDLFRASLGNVPRGVIIAGEAGIGKTRLLRDFAAGLGSDIAVAVGHCVGMGRFATPFEPVREALRDLVAAFGADTVSAVAGPVRLATLAALVPELDGGETERADREQLHEAVRDLLVGLSRITPVLVVLEDLQWADAATLDLLRAVMGRFRGGRLMLALSYRTDEVGRTDPLRPFLVELERMRHVFRIDLRRLSPEEIEAQVAHLRGPDHGVDVASLSRRSDGVPFLVEELVALDGHALPESLRDVVLARYHGVGRPTQAVLRMLAAGGVSVPHDLVEAVHDGDPSELEAALREAVEAHILSARDTSYAFRHALSQEAIEGELLPGESARFHARYAEELERAGGAGSAAQIAHHWTKVRNWPRAFQALHRATREARATGALVSAASFGEQALELWSAVPDAPTVAGCTRTDFVLDVAALFMETADPRSLALLQRELARCAADDHRSRALLLHEQTIFAQGLGQPGICELAEAAYAELPPDGDDLDRLARVRVTCGLGIAQAFYGDPEVGWGRLQEALEGARVLMEGDADDRVKGRARAEFARALTSISSIRGYSGDVDGALEGLAEVQAMNADPDAFLRASGLRLDLLRLVGRHREALEEGLAALTLARETWRQRSWGSAISLHVMNVHLDLGDLPAAERMGQELIGLGPWTFAGGYCRLAQMDILRLRDRAGQARDLMRQHAQAIDGARRSATGRLTVARAVGAVALAVDDLPGAWEQVECLWDGHRSVASRAALRLTVLGAEVVAALRSSHADGILSGEGYPFAAAEQRLRSTLDSLALWEVVADWRALVEARLGGADGAGTDVGAWQEAVAAAERGRVPIQCHSDALFRLGEVQIMSGDRLAAEETLDQAAHLSGRIHDLLTLRKVTELRSRAHLLAAVPHSTQAPAHLTDRERQVLHLVAEGLTNREIGKHLFISDKTASVHVSAILRKLGVGSRTEAAVIAARLQGAETGRDRP